MSKHVAFDEKHSLLRPEKSAYVRIEEGIESHSNHSLNTESAPEQSIALPIVPLEQAIDEQIRKTIRDEPQVMTPVEKSG